MKNIYILQITKNCNQDCIYCCRDVQTKENSLLEIKKNILNLKNIEQIIITGGEPTLRKDLPEIIKYINNFSYKIHLQTNGINFKDLNYCKKIVNNGLNSALVALPTFNNETCNKITNKKNILKDKIKGIKNLAKFFRLKLGVVFVPTNLNYKEFIIYVKRISKISRDIYIQVSYPIKSYKKKNYKMVKYKELSKYINEGAKICKEKNIELRIDGIPICYIPDLINYVSDLKTRRYEFTQDFIEQKRKKYDSNNYKGKEHIKIKKCKKCNFNQLCKGFYKHYADKFMK
ncbi:MAG: radical SAM protein [Candidatus Woesearchaeota archaeon]